MPKPLPIVAIRNYRRLGLQCATLEEFADWMSFTYNGGRAPNDIQFREDAQGAPRVTLGTYCAEADENVCQEMLAQGKCVNPAKRTVGRPRKETA